MSMFVLKKILEGDPQSITTAWRPPPAEAEGKGQREFIKLIVIILILSN